MCSSYKTDWQVGDRVRVTSNDRTGRVASGELRVPYRHSNDTYPVVLVDLDAALRTESDEEQTTVITLLAVHPANLAAE